MSLNVISCPMTKLSDLTPEPGQVVAVTDDNGHTTKVIMWSGTEWTEVKADTNSEVTLTAYDMNKQLIHQLPSLTEEELDDKKNIVVQFVNDTDNEYYMLLCREMNYFTLCHRVPDMNPSPADNVRQYLEWPNEIITIEDLVIECARVLGEIKAIEQVDGAVEIWVDNPMFEDCTCAMYFFPYDGGVEACQ